MTRLPIDDSILTKLNTKKAKEEVEQAVLNLESQKEAVEYKVSNRDEITNELQSFSRWLNKEALFLNDDEGLIQDFDVFSNQRQLFSRTLQRPLTIKTFCFCFRLSTVSCDHG